MNLNKPPGVIPDGQAEAANENLRLENERKEAARQLAEQLVQHYLRSGDRRTCITMMISGADLDARGLASKYLYHKGVFALTAEILRQSNWHLTSTTHTTFALTPGSAPSKPECTSAPPPSSGRWRWFV